MGITEVHVHKHKQLHKRAVDHTECPTGGFTSPTNGQTIDSLQPLNITWNTNCLDTDSIDLYLQAPGASHSRIYAWQAINFKLGYFETELYPRWWNATASQGLQLTMIPTGMPPFMNELSAGPVFTATYTEPESGTPPSADLSQHDVGWSVVNNFPSDDKGSSSGKIAAGVLVPLLFLGLLGFGYLKYMRKKGKKDRKRWSEAVDKRMSTISADWKSISAAGATAAIRNSIAVSSSGNLTNRASSFSFGGGIRPVSTAGAVEGDDGASIPESRFTRPMSQMRPGVGLRNPVGSGVGFGAQAERQSRVSFAEGTRISRVSFADAPRPSLDSRKSAGVSRAFHTGFVPPLPDNAASTVAAAAASTTSLTHKKNPTITTTDITEAPRASSDDGVDTPGIMSPTQTAGPVPLTAEDIRSKLAAAASTTSLPRRSEEGVHGGRDGYADMMPALSMIRTTTTDSPIDSEFLFDVPPTPAPAPAHHRQPRSPSYPSLPRTVSGGMTNNSNGSMSNISAFDSVYEIDTNVTTATATTATVASPTTLTMSPVMSTMTMQPMATPASTMSPDDMLRAYAEQRKRGSTSPNPPSRSNSILGRSGSTDNNGTASPRSSGVVGGLISGITSPLNLAQGKKKKRAEKERERLSKFGTISAPISYPSPVASGNGMRILYEQQEQEGAGSGTGKGDEESGYKGAVGV